MRVLVAGGAGFIRSNLCETLLDAGHDVTYLDDLVTGRKRNIDHLEATPAFTCLRQDVIPGLPDLPHCDLVFNLASPASPPGYQRHAIETLQVNNQGSEHLLNFTRSCDARYLYASTSEVYGDPLEHPQREDYRGNVSSIGPRSMYDEAKRFGEALAVAYRNEGVDARIVRIFNTYGPRSDPLDGRMVPNFITQALANEPITVYGDGSQTRSLCYVTDLVRGFMAVMGGDAARGEVINLGNPEEHTVLEFANLIIELTGSASKLVLREQVVGDDPQRRRPDIDKARRLLGWEPSVGLRDGLSKTIDYFRAELSGENV